MSFLCILQLDVDIYVSSYHSLTFWDSDLSASFTTTLNTCSSLNSCIEDGLTGDWETKMGKSYNGHKIW